MEPFRLWFTKQFLQIHCLQDPCNSMDTCSLLHPVTTDYAKEHAVIFSITNAQILSPSSLPIDKMCTIIFFAHIVLYDALVSTLSCLYFYLSNM